MSKSAKIRKLIEEGLDNATIVKKLKVNVNLIHQVRWQMKNGRQAKKAVSTSRKEVLNRTMPKKPSKIMMSVTEMNTALDALGISKKPDLVNNPPHYKVGGIDTLDFIEAKDLNFRLANVIKYVVRAEKKGNPLEDLKKAQFYLNREITVRENA
jgi:hypothetical protein